MLKAQSLKPQGLRDSHGQKKGSFDEVRFGHTFLALFEEAQSMPRCIFYFIAKKDMNHQN